MKKTIIAITGGIGTGKSVVSKICAQFNVPVYDCDAKAKLLMNDDAQLIANIKALFGDEAYVQNSLNRNFIASQVFNSPKLLAKLNTIVHPAVKNDISRWAASQSYNVVAIETAILLESNLSDIIDIIILVDAPLDVRIDRAAKRDNVESQLITKRIENQTPQSELKKIANHIVINDNLQPLLPQIYNIISHIKKQYTN